MNSYNSLHSWGHQFQFRHQFQCRENIKSKNMTKYKSKINNFLLYFIFILQLLILAFIYNTVYDDTLRSVITTQQSSVSKEFQKLEETTQSSKFSTTVQPPKMFTNTFVQEVSNPKNELRPPYFLNKNSKTLDHCQDLYSHPNGTSKNQRHLDSNQRIKFAFLKTPKCASSLLQKIFKDYMIKHSIDRKKSTLGPLMGGYPGKFDNEISMMNERDPGGTKNLPGSIINHMIWNLPELKKNFDNSDNFFRIGLIRHPMSHYISAWNFYFGSRPDSRFNITMMCYGEPYKQIYDYTNFTRNNGLKPDNYNIGSFFSVADQENQLDQFKNAFWGFRAMNYLSKVYGLEWREKISDVSIIENRVKEFDVIIILERLIESLILVKNLLCMDMKDIILEDYECGRCSHNQTMSDFLKDMAKIENLKKPIVYQTLPTDKLAKYNLTVEQAQVIENKLSFNDIELYNAAGRQFERNLRDFGYENMQREIEEFARLTEEASKNDNESKRRKRRRTRKRRKRGSSSEPKSRVRRLSHYLHTEPEFKKLVNYMIKDGQGYCGYWKLNFGTTNVADLEIDQRQPWIDEVDFSKFD